MNFTSPFNLFLAMRTVLKLYVVINFDLIFKLDQSKLILC